MRLLCAICAIALLSQAGCYQSHRRGEAGADGGFDAHIADASVRDLGAPDLDLDLRDSAVALSCSDQWLALPWCPASPERAIGQPCVAEGTRCGDGCCDVRPPIQCLAGTWQPLDVDLECAGVRCRTPVPCGSGACMEPGVCLRVEDWRGDSPETTRCAMPTTPIASCDAAPLGTVVEEGACMLCHCAEVGGSVQIALECACCDGS